MKEIKFINVCFSDSDDVILEDITLEIYMGHIYTIIGPSGAGKSTLIKLINRLIDATEGKILIDGNDIKNYDIIQLRRKIGMVFQQPYLFEGTVEDNIKYGPMLKGKRDVDVEYYLRIVGLDKSYSKKKVDDLSGGEAQRISIARTLANEPEVLLLDEPTSALDPASTQVIEELVIDLKNKLNLTFIWITHNMEQAKRVGDYTIFINKGRLVEYGETRNFFLNPIFDVTKLFIDGKLTKEEAE
ncbi:phosphate ABC transporter ATP-binding protein [Thermoanaerobacterium thermosaccharolyticum]|jgi:putative ABC transport system ATP-binding protein|uniref:Phosphate ABC transporter ATP-binding protein n=1 Tax=Thermoanaerobacterium thermosaccharolyticum TaxID=1517 RepID=A0A231VAW5_THETR|nr:phosphate ABC transporter ATP-binding protein [Thermoanaerobacterium thermosaccharolyticum]AST56596.1 phosphate ABC transporter ATP-binding protein [Thermoanaerobacterium thermosaccharolyticum]MCP2239917.1 putative ABC transport system ATP-binding protein [Thermoanaerobacterium thermosaccharolyticum]OXT05323.1 phosphate ABC transporter ATP-binding protein [Thermoanaerobacterium thermosaccharolyticum]TCW34818.1 putative ABC transport system ATP-binding protein [Thermohydrogenium kirishiense]